MQRKSNEPRTGRSVSLAMPEMWYRKQKKAEQGRKEELPPKGRGKKEKRAKTSRIS
jgi:hypothetical protein